MTGEGLEYKPWWSKGLYFSCLGCGRCCRGDPGAIWVSDEDITAAARYLEKNEGDFRRSFLTGRWKRPSLREKPNGECVMYSSLTARCMIYPVRPPQCSLFPFWPSLLRSRSDWDRASADCPGMNNGKFFSAEEIESLLLKSPYPDL
ncbi:MAG TPA: YkgJ family cysteine cluster protein [Synergistales bacterium]|nr:YkgJ family cysteine cluster protein [Synergistales bacterium]HRV70949.1 YkgJ family cysteine cluster protein [Thermovirgaceae bacterium]